MMPDRKIEFLTTGLMEAHLRSMAMERKPQPLKHGDSDGTSSGMDKNDLHGRVARLEGANGALMGAVAIVSAVLIGGLALIWSDVNNLENKVENLPSAIREELQGLNAATFQAIEASRQPAAPVGPPAIFYVPAPEGTQGISPAVVPDVQQPTPSPQTGATSGE